MAGARHFHCTACGLCCYGWLPLSLDDAVTHAERFPLALVWTPVRPGGRAYALAARLGVKVTLRDRKEVAVLIVPTAYIPPALPCPALAADGRCGIHADKPSRCRTMPFYPWREEHDQAELLVPRKGWACDISAAAPVVYRDRAILDRGDFDRERQQLEQQVPVIRTYGAYMLKYRPWLVDGLAKAAAKPAAGHVVTSLSSFLTATRRPDAALLAARQLPVLRAYADKTASDPALADYHQQYSSWAQEMAYLAERATRSDPAATPVLNPE